MVSIDFDEDAFVENLDNWNQLNLQNYSYEYSNSGCPGTGIAADIGVKITNGEVDTLVDLSENGIQYADQDIIDDLFAEIQATYDENEGSELTSNGYLKEISVVYDEDYYFPKEVCYVYHTPEDVEGLWNRYQYIKAFEVQD